jgi:hypothetical protein
MKGNTFSHHRVEQPQQTCKSTEAAKGHTGGRHHDVEQQPHARASETLMLQPPRISMAAVAVE